MANDYPGLSVKLPLTYNPNTARYTLLSTHQELVHQNFKMLLLTNPGERIMDLRFGIGLLQFLFEPEEPFFFQDIRSKIQEQVSIYMPYIEIENIEINESVVIDKQIVK